jgi:hypothetical protein
MSIEAQAAAEWLATRDVIAEFLARSSLGGTVEQAQHNAAAIIARLAHHNPPILFDMQPRKSTLSQAKRAMRSAGLPGVLEKSDGQVVWSAFENDGLTSDECDKLARILRGANT